MIEMPEMLVGGEEARLFPVLSESSKEGRALSIFLACLATVNEFGTVMLDTVGQRIGSRARINSFTEVELAEMPDDVPRRPDGMIHVSGGGRKRWNSLVEAKIGRNKLDGIQIDNYLKLAKTNGLDAVVTISNEFAAVPHHHPLRIYRFPKGIDLFHWSWASILTYAKIVLAEMDEPNYILKELIRFFEHPSTGVMRFNRMDVNWKDVVGTVASGAKLAKTSDIVMDTIGNWHQECRDVALKLTECTGTKVVIKLSREHKNSSRKRIVLDAANLVATSRLSATFVIPDAASPMILEADLQTRTIQVAMTVNSPDDKKSLSGKLNWILRQITESNGKDLYVKAIWTAKRQTMFSLEDVRVDRNILDDGKDGIPTAFEIRLVRGIGHRFSGAKTFIDDLEKNVLCYYTEVGQKLKLWHAPAPKVIPEATEESSVPPST